MGYIQDREGLAVLQLSIGHQAAEPCHHHISGSVSHESRQLVDGLIGPGFIVAHGAAAATVMVAVVMGSSLLLRHLSIAPLLRGEVDFNWPALATHLLDTFQTKARAPAVHREGGYRVDSKGEKRERDSVMILGESLPSGTPVQGKS